jgi:hypothetical protein
VISTTYIITVIIILTMERLHGTITQKALILISTCLSQYSLGLVIAIQAVLYTNWVCYISLVLIRRLIMISSHIRATVYLKKKF